MQDCTPNKSIPWWLRGRECSHFGAVEDLAKACDGRKSCRITAEAGQGHVFPINPCQRQEPFVIMMYLCESRKVGLQRALNNDDEDDFVPNHEDEEGLL